MNMIDERMATEDEQACYARVLDGGSCTRPTGYAGDHVAHGTEGQECAREAQDPAQAVS